MEEAQKNEIKTALIDLYLSVKVRKSQEIEQYSEEKLEEEREILKRADEMLIIGYIKTSVEILMNLRSEEQEMSKEESNSMYSEKSQGDPPKKYEKLLQKLEDETRNHIRVFLRKSKIFFRLNNS